MDRSDYELLPRETLIDLLVETVKLADAAKTLIELQDEKIRKLAHYLSMFTNREYQAN